MRWWRRTLTLVNLFQLKPVVRFSGSFAPASDLAFRISGRVDHPGDAQLSSGLEELVQPPELPRVAKNGNGCASEQARAVVEDVVAVASTQTTQRNVVDVDKFVGGKLDAELSQKRSVAVKWKWNFGYNVYVHYIWMGPNDSCRSRESSKSRKSSFWSKRKFPSNLIG